MNPLFDEIDDFLSAKRALQVQLYAAVRAPDDACFLAWMIESGQTWPVMLTMPCGTRVVVDAAEHTPHESMPCPCGNPGEYVFWYTGQAQQRA